MKPSERLEEIAKAIAANLARFAGVAEENAVIVSEARWLALKAYLDEQAAHSGWSVPGPPVTTIEAKLAEAEPVEAP